eukprot:NODE_1668_length_1088_cov_331.086157.p1 GENE.NODE_1668_length_1088_cov_331.086157~~NODE_1668_length_1088_cov_331.086157.p1  ORF type:complete len:313 (-),score=58.73 NODE_1668_length_1088_cov_331.086157:74-1012(-)
MPLSVATADSHESQLMLMAAQAVGVFVFYTLIFYAAAWANPCWARHFVDSSKPHENERYWNARFIMNLFQSVPVSAVCIPLVFELLPASPHVQFAAVDTIGFCAVSHKTSDTELWPWRAEAYVVGAAGLVFTTFTFVDLVLMTLHRLARLDEVVHHIAFIFAGVLIRTNCMLPLNAALLMAMEVSTPFLNYVLFFRHRGDRYATCLSVSGAIFLVLYVVFRLGLNLYGTVLLWLNIQYALHRVPDWQGWGLAVAITIGSVLQFVWFPGIWRIAVSRWHDVRAPVTVPDTAPLIPNSDGPTETCSPLDPSTVA